MRGPDLVAAGRPEGQQDQRPLYFADHPVVEPGGWQTAFVRGEITLDVALARRGKPASARSLRGITRRGRVAELGLDDPAPNYLLRIERRQPPNQVLQLTHVPGPAIGAQPLHCGIVEPLQRQSFPYRQGGKVADQRGYIGASFTQRRQPYRRHVQTGKHVLARQTLPDQLAQLVMRRGDDPHFGPDRYAAADRREL